MYRFLTDADAPFNVRRNFYYPNSPAGKGATWEWEGDGSDGTREWHTYDMEVQCLVETAWARGEQTIDISKTRLGFPYIINFCNLTQVRANTGYVRNVRRIQQAPYPLIKLSPEEVDSFMGMYLFIRICSIHFCHPWKLSSQFIRPNEAQIQSKS